MAHETTVCERDVKETIYIGKGYKSIYRCPVCQRASWQALNFLGRRKLMCDGLKLRKVA